jgi:hypothetical protein
VRQTFGQKEFKHGISLFDGSNRFLTGTLRYPLVPRTGSGQTRPRPGWPRVAATMAASIKLHWKKAVSPPQRIFDPLKWQGAGGTSMGGAEDRSIVCGFIMLTLMEAGRYIGRRLFQIFSKGIDWGPSSAVLVAVCGSPTRN